MKQAKNILLGALLLALFAPVIAGFLFNLQEKPLEGTNNNAQKPDITIDNIKSGKLREEIDEYLKLKMGFRAWLTRCFNEMDYQLFAHTNAPGVEVGSNNMLYLRSYIDEYTGANLLPDSIINMRVNNLKQISDTLEAHGKKLLIVFAPGKASYYPENIPVKFSNGTRPTTNYDFYADKFSRYKLNFIDLNGYFSNNLKGKTTYPLYPETGVHWTNYGSLLALDTICKWINNNTASYCPLPQYTINTSAELKDEDYDVGKLMNTFTTLPHNPMPYATITGLAGDTSHKPKVMVISDSYWWTLVSKQYPAMVFANDKFIFYNKDIYVNNVKQEVASQALDMKAEILNYDIVMLMSSEATYYMFPYFFDEDALISKQERIEQKKREIIASPEWMKGIKQRAGENKISIEEMITREAVWSVEHRR